MSERYKFTSCDGSDLLAAKIVSETEFFQCFSLLKLYLSSKTHEMMKPYQFTDGANPHVMNFVT